MTNILDLTGQVVTVGNLQPEDAPALASLPRVEIQLQDSRLITIIGLTRAEAIAFGQFLYRESVRVICESAP